MSYQKRIFPSYVAIPIHYKTGDDPPTPVDSSSVPIYDTPSWDTVYGKSGQNHTMDHDCFMEKNPVYLMAKDKETQASQHVYEGLWRESTDM